MDLPEEPTVEERPAVLHVRSPDDLAAAVATLTRPVILHLAGGDYRMPDSPMIRGFISCSGCNQGKGLCRDTP